MPDGPRTRWGVPVVAGLAFAAVAAALWLAQAPAPGPQPVAWDRVRCAQCGMLVSDPRFAAQLRTEPGALAFFDDPGCLLRFRAARENGDRDVFLRDAASDRWIPLADAVFVPGHATPMGYGLGARVRGEADGMSYDSALAAALARDERRGVSAP